MPLDNGEKSYIIPNMMPDPRGGGRMGGGGAASPDGGASRPPTAATGTTANWHHKNKCLQEIPKAHLKSYGRHSLDEVFRRRWNAITNASRLVIEC